VIISVIASAAKQSRKLRIAGLLRHKLLAMTGVLYFAVKFFTYLLAGMCFCRTFASYGEKVYNATEYFLERRLIMKRIILAALLVAAALLLAACSPRDVLSAEEFTSRMEAEGHVVEDITGMMNLPDIETFLVADLGDFVVEFIVCDTEATARSMRSTMQSVLDNESGNTRSTRESNVSNFHRFTQTTDGRFEALVRVENTVLLMRAPSENRSDVEAILDLLGY